MDTAPTVKKSGYGKRPLWQWIAIYVVIGGLLYTGIYYAIARKGGYRSSGSPPTTRSGY